MANLMNNSRLDLFAMCFGANFSNFDKNYYRNILVFVDDFLAKLFGSIYNLIIRQRIFQVFALKEPGEKLELINLELFDL